MATASPNFYDIGLDRRDAVSAPVVSTRRFANAKLSPSILTIGDSKSMWMGTQTIKIDRLYVSLLLINVMLTVLAIITYFTFTSKLEGDCKTPTGINVATGILYSLLFMLTVRQFAQMRNRVNPQHQVPT